MLKGQVRCKVCGESELVDVLVEYGDGEVVCTTCDNSNYSQFINVEPISVSAIIAEFEVVLEDKLGKDLTSNDIAEIKERLENHKNCLERGEVVVVTYGENNVSMECEKCNEVVIYSGVLEEEDEVVEVTCIHCGDDFEADYSKEVCEEC